MASEAAGVDLTVLAAPAKLTVSLRVTGVRDDGYHLIDAEMVSLDLADELVVTEGDGFEVVEGHDLGFVHPEDNLVGRALRAVGRRAHVTLRKRMCAIGGVQSKQQCGSMRIRMRRWIWTARLMQ